ncbi:hypothetical protein [Qipengyuania gelatinilytica]|uniref:Uncharacterized protein n=1 Tax=Qipengyuania gelatinilytica TaxID=2867231 RepID=A0ABX9A4R9_9SPHN|nr:hypothetical protein [Qipengyuania gelatinilytica]QZD96220.1 hypothetical protein K3136_05890 [Qipengyuania gelatinilytica]
MWPFEKRQDGEHFLSWLWGQVAIAFGSVFILVMVAGVFEIMFEKEEPVVKPYVYIPAGGGYADNYEEPECYTDWDGRNNPTVCE